MKTSLICLALLTLSISIMGQNNPAYKIYNAKGKKVKYKKMLKQLNKTDVVLFGELHNCSLGHWLELEVAEDLYLEKGKKLVLGAEMFERDGDTVLHQYLIGEVDEEYFLKNAGIWPNYDTDYRPLVEFAKEKSIRFIGTNIPRAFASKVFKEGIESLEQLSAAEKRLMAPLPVTVDLELPGYKAMLDMFPDHNTGNFNFPNAQAVKDATMAFFILKNLKPGDLFLHYNGAYHSRNYEGIVWYLEHYKPGTKVKTIDMVLQKDISKLEKDNTGKADFIICIPENMTKTYTQ